MKESIEDFAIKFIERIIQENYLIDDKMTKKQVANRNKKEKIRQKQNTLDPTSTYDNHDESNDIWASSDEETDSSKTKRDNPFLYLHKYTSHPNKLSRRLDSLARLLVGNENVASVCFVMKDKKLMFVAASNKENHQGKNDFMRQCLDKLIAHIQPLVLATDCFDKATRSISKLTALTRANFAVFALQPFISQTIKLRKGKENFVVPLIKHKSNKEIALSDKEAISLLVGHFNSYLEENFNANENEVITGWWLSFEEEYITTTIDNFVEERIKRFFKDIIKVEEAFVNREYNADIIEAVALGKLEPMVFDTMLTNEGCPKIHAEMKILEFLVKNKLRTSYIGINKLCCAHCNIVLNSFASHIKIKSIAEIYDEYNEENQVARGFHGKSYGWGVSDYWLDSDNSDIFFKNLLGENLFKKFISMPNDREELLGIIQNINLYRSKLIDKISPEIRKLVEDRKKFEKDAKEYSMKEEADDSEATEENEDTLKEQIVAFSDNIKHQTLLSLLRKKLKADFSISSQVTIKYDPNIKTSDKDVDLTSNLAISWYQKPKIIIPAILAVTGIGIMALNNDEQLSESISRIFRI